MKKPDNQSRQVLRAGWMGAAGFTLGGVAALLLLIAMRWLDLGQRITDWLPDEQYFARILTRVLLLGLFLVIAGGVTGAIGGWTLTRIDPKAPQRRYITAGILAYLFSGLLLAGFLLLLALIGAVNNANDLSPVRFASLFGIYGFIFGALTGLPLGLLSVGGRYFWRAWLASILGYTLGGVLLGLLMWVYATRQDVGLPFNGLLLATLGFLAIFAPGGAALGAIYAWIGGQRSLGRRVPGRVSPFWAITGAIVLAVAVYGLFRLGSKVYSFITIQQGSLSSQIGLETIGVAWNTAQPVAERDQQAPDPATLRLAGGAAGQVARLWSDSAGEIWLSQGIYDEAGRQTTWSAPVNVSGTTDAISRHPQAVAAPDGGWLVAWEEETEGGESSEIWLAACQAVSCRPAVSLSGPGMPACATGGSRHVSPAIAVDNLGNRMATWLNENGDLIYSAWGNTESPPKTPTGCGPAGGASPPLSLAGGRDGAFHLAYRSAASAAILESGYTEGAWSSTTQAGSGSDPFLLRDSAGRMHLAWCSLEKEVSYRREDGLVRTAGLLNFPACAGQPVLVEDSQYQVHLLWHTEEIRNNFGNPVTGSFIVESIDTLDGLTQAAIAARPGQAGSVAAANDAQGTLFLTWIGLQDERQAMLSAEQTGYACEEPPATPVGQAVLETMQAGNYRPEGTPIPYCGNQFERLLFVPEPPPDLPIPDTLNGAFDTVAALVESVRYEVLFTTMEYQQDANDDSPGYVLADAVVDLYERLKANPENYPRGLTIRILLGNYPNLSTLEFGDQIYHVLEDLHAAGLPTMSDPSLGWKVEVANFDGQYPHGHTKFMVVDGKTVTSAGFNYSYLHYLTDHPSGKGDSLVDLGMQVSGPAAQAALAEYDDLWAGSNQIVCNTLDPILDTWQLACNWTTAEASHVPEVLKFSLPPGGNSTVFSLLRTAKYLESDQALLTAIRSATTSLDFFEVNYSLEIQCMLNLIDPTLCNFDQSLEYMRAMLDALEENPVKVRVLFTDVNSNGIENFIAADVLRQELEQRGLSEWVDIRYWPERMHAKAILVDGQLLIIGSQNMHYSSFGEHALTEFNLATENPQAIETFRQTFEYYWERSLPVEEGGKPTTAP